MPGLIVHEWLARAGGSENVVEQFVRAFPDADLQVLWNDDPERFAHTQVYETWLARTPLRHHKALALPFLPATWRARRARRSYDWILTSSHLFAHHVRLVGADEGIPKYSYIHTPARYIWEPELDHRGRGRLVRLAGSAFKPVDRKRARESDKLAANSEFTRKRIQRSWDRDSEVIYPPVNTEEIRAGGDWRNKLSTSEIAHLESLPENFLLGASRFVSYKQLDRVIDAGEANDLPVVLAGRGPGYEELKHRSASSAVPVHFSISPSNALLYALYQRALALVFPAIEDFGIMPVEAMAAGTPVVVQPVGGAVESVVAAEGGAIVHEPTAIGWRKAVAEAALIDRRALPERVDRFSAGRFRSEIAAWVA